MRIELTEKQIYILYAIILAEGEKEKIYKLLFKECPDLHSIQAKILLAQIDNLHNQDIIFIQRISNADRTIVKYHYHQTLLDRLKQRYPAFFNPTTS